MNSFVHDNLTSLIKAVRYNYWLQSVASVVIRATCCICYDVTISVTRRRRLAVIGHVIRNHVHKVFEVSKWRVAGARNSFRVVSKRNISPTVPYCTDKSSCILDILMIERFIGCWPLQTLLKTVETRHWQAWISQTNMSWPLKLTVTWKLFTRTNKFADCNFCMRQLCDSRHVTINSGCVLLKDVCANSA